MSDEKVGMPERVKELRAAMEKATAFRPLLMPVVESDFEEWPAEIRPLLVGAVNSMPDLIDAAEQAERYEKALTEARDLAVRVHFGHECPCACANEIAEIARAALSRLSKGDAPR